MATHLIADDAAAMQPTELKVTIFDFNCRYLFPVGYSPYPDTSLFTGVVPLTLKAACTTTPGCWYIVTIIVDPV